MPAPQDVPPLAAQGPRPLRRRLQRGVGENWGFAPYSQGDLDTYAQEMQLAFDRDWFMVAETADRRAGGAAITVPGPRPGARGG